MVRLLKSRLSLSSLWLDGGVRCLIVIAAEKRKSIASATCCRITFVSLAVNVSRASTILVGQSIKRSVSMKGGCLDESQRTLQRLVDRA